MSFYLLTYLLRSYILGFMKKKKNRQKKGKEGVEDSISKFVIAQKLKWYKGFDMWS